MTLTCWAHSGDVMRFLRNTDKHVDHIPQEDICSIQLLYLRSDLVMCVEYVLMFVFIRTFPCERGFSVI
jgi:hypothetical protein